MFQLTICWLFHVVQAQWRHSVGQMLTTRRQRMAGIAYPVYGFMKAWASCRCLSSCSTKNDIHVHTCYRCSLRCGCPVKRDFCRFNTFKGPYRREDHKWLIIWDIGRDTRRPPHSGCSMLKFSRTWTHNNNASRGTVIKNCGMSRNTLTYCTSIFNFVIGPQIFIICHCCTVEYFISKTRT